MYQSLVSTCGSSTRVVLAERRRATPTQSTNDHMRPSPTLTYASHSGFGNQIQALLVAVLLSRLTRMPLILPPLCGDHKDCLTLPKRLLHRGCSMLPSLEQQFPRQDVYWPKHKTQFASERWFERRCSKGNAFDSFLSVYDVSQVAGNVTDRVCTTYRRCAPRFTLAACNVCSCRYSTR